MYCNICYDYTSLTYNTGLNTTHFKSSYNTNTLKTILFGFNYIVLK